MNKVLVSMLLLSTVAFAGQLTVKLENQQVVARACQLPSGTRAVWFFVGKIGYAKNGVAQRETKFENGCAVKTYNNTSNDLFLNGGEVYASYDEFGRQPVQTNPDTVPIPRRDTGSTPTPTPNPPTPNPNPTPGPTPNPNPPPVDNKKEMDPRKVRNYAEQAANFFANRVVEIYGRVENYKYNFYVGFKKAAALYNNLGVSVQSLPQYNYGYQNGLIKGRDEGFSRGQQQGNQDGSSMGRQDAVNRFYSAIDNVSQLDTNIGAVPDGSQYRPTNPSLTAPDMNSRLGKYNDQYYQEIRSGMGFDSEVDFDDELSDMVYGRRIGLGDYYSWNDYKDEVLYSSWKGENALNLFLSKRLIKNSSVDYNKVKVNNELVALYKEITDPEIYKDAAENRRIYRAAFINQYDDTIVGKWNREVYQKTNYSAQARGEYYFTQAIQSYAQDVGYNDGYIRNYGPSSLDGYRQTVGPAYRQSFSQTVTHYSQNPVLGEIQVSLVNQDGKSTFAVIDSVVAVLNKVVNAGKVPGKLVVQIQPHQALNNGSNKTIEIDVPGLTRLTSRQVLGVVSQVSTAVQPDENYQIQVRTNTGTLSMNMGVSWHQTVQQIGRDTPQRQQVLVQYLSQKLGQEFKDMVSVFNRNRYKHEPQVTLAGKFVAAYISLSPQEQQVLKQYQSAIVAGIGKRPSNFICVGCGKGEWDAAQVIFQQIGWSLPR